MHTDFLEGVGFADTCLHGLRMYMLMELEDSDEICTMEYRSSYSIWLLYIGTILAQAYSSALYFHES